MIAHTQHFAARVPSKGRTADDRASDLAAREAALTEREAQMAARGALLERDRRLSLREEAITMREQAMGGSKAGGTPDALARQIADEAMALQAKAEKSGGAKLSIVAAVDQVVRNKGLASGGPAPKAAKPGASAAFKESHLSKRREREKAAIAAKSAEAPKPQDQQPEQLAREIVVAAEKLQAEERSAGRAIGWAAAVSIVSQRMKPREKLPTAATPLRPFKA